MIEAGGPVPPPKRSPERLFRSAGVGTGFAIGLMISTLAVVTAFVTSGNQNLNDFARTMGWFWLGGIAAGFLALVWAVRTRRRDISLGLGVYLGLAGLLATACFFG